MYYFVPIEPLPEDRIENNASLAGNGFDDLIGFNEARDWRHATVEFGESVLAIFPRCLRTFPGQV
ncbi:hypothetical protein CXK98_19575 [Stutzerimonas kunmingensis]|nr:hypothetical protein CXK98_19575 [Stutzerimonas kunmingensis]